jgi:hypothetical protein
MFPERGGYEAIKRQRRTAKYKAWMVQALIMNYFMAGQGIKVSKHMEANVTVIGQ